MDALKKRLLHSATGKQWEKIGVRTHHGINFPLSALHSENSCGIGEFFDLIPMIDWCARLKIDFIQLLPLNNSNSETDPSPYNAISSCSLNFLYLSLHELPFLNDLPELQEKLKDFKKFNLTETVPFSDLFSPKLNWLRDYYNAAGSLILEKKAFKTFLEDNLWLKPYALFKTLKDHLKNTSWKTWPDDLRYPTPEKLQTLYEQYAPSLSFYYCMQFLCFTQLKNVKEHAASQGVHLMGDIPILLSSESADVWQNLEYFDHHLAAGAPPDFYNKEGQYWGFPIFNWDAMRKNHFDWWKQRLSYAENFFDLFRLDHIIGFFRIWAIPPNHPSKEGHYLPEDKKEWEKQGKELLTMITDATTMLPIGEDLGTVPDVVRPCLNTLGICGTKVMRWEKNWETDKSFLPIDEYPPVSLTCISTHDSETLALWWRDFPDEAREFADYKGWTYAPDLTAEQREEILRDSHHTSSLFHVNLLQEYLALFPELVHSTPEAERINIPGTIAPTNWTYRFRPTVEELTAHKGLFTKMQGILF